MRFSTASILLCFIAIHSFSQPDKIASSLFTTPVIQIEPSTLLHADGIRNTLQATIIGEYDDFYKYWKKYLKSNYALEGRRTNGLYVCGPTRSASLSEDSISVFYKVEKEGDFTKLTCFGEKKGQYFPDAQLPESNKLEVALEKGILQYYTQLYDEKINAQQKYFDRQVKDAERVQKAGQKMMNDKVSSEKSLERTKSALSASNNRLREIENEKKSLEAELDLEKKEEEQIKKEIKSQEDLLKEKELEYNEKYFGASAEDRRAEKGRKDLEARREKIGKQQEKLEKKNERITSVENKILRSERKLNETQTAIEKQEAEISRLRNTIDELVSKISTNGTDYKEEVLQMESAKADLDRLKLAKGGLLTLN